MQLTKSILLTSVLSTLAQAAGLKPKYVKFDVETKKGSDLFKRDGDVETSLNDNYSYYTTQIKVGSNKQQINVLLDTGSDALWVIKKGECDGCLDGSFDSSQSSSYSKINDDFSITYGSGSASGEWATDTIVIGGATVSQQRFAVCTEHPFDWGIMGLTVSPDDSGADPSYENLPKRLKTDGAIDKIVYSFYAGNHGDSKGTLLFGALDHSKYTGGLYTVPMQQDTITVDLGGVNIDSSDSSVKSQVLFNSPHTALIDTGTSTTSLPTDAFNAFIDAIGATKTSSGGYDIDCSLMDKDIALNFDFSGVRIKVPLSDLVYQVSSTCSLGVVSSDSRLLFGANALRACYTVFDLEDHQIGLAQANTNPGDENIEVITGSIPT